MSTNWKFVESDIRYRQILYVCVQVLPTNHMSSSVYLPNCTFSWARETDRYLDLMFRIRIFTDPMTFNHQDLWYAKLVPSSNQRGKPSHTILCTFSGGVNQIWKGIPISNDLREEWALVNVSSCSGGMLAASFRSLYKSISLQRQVLI